MLLKYCDCPLALLQGTECETQLPLVEKSDVAALTASAPADIEKQEPTGKKQSQHLFRIVSTASMLSHRRKVSVISSISSMDFTGSTAHVHTVISATNSTLS
jgi:hypothetical protein